jgi:hypothetical protein
MTPEERKDLEDRQAQEAREYKQMVSPRHTRMIDATKDTNPKDAIGVKKPPLSTLPMPVLFELGAAMLEGACKYRRHNYRISGVRASIYFDATMRHLAAYWEGEDIDPDSGVHHITKAMASLLVLRDAMMNDKVLDDRPPVADPLWMSKVQDRVDDVLGRYPKPLPPYTNDPNLDIGL